MQIFDRPFHRWQREKAAATLSQVDFLLQESANRIADRVHDLSRHFPLALDLGSHQGQLATPLCHTGKVGQLIHSDFAMAMAVSCPGVLKLVADEEFLPFSQHSLDAVFSNLSLQWINDLPGCLVQIRRVLKPDGLLMAAVPGPQSLQELRNSLLAVAETGKYGYAPRISPFVEIRDAGGLLQRAGFALPVIASETITLTYAEPFKLLQELKHMGESNALHERHKGLTTADFWHAVMEYYQQHFSDEQGRIKATIELITMTAWAPAASQQQPAKRGSGKMSLKDVFQ